MIRLLGPRYNSSRRFCDHAAYMPLAVEICHLPPGPGNRRTKTSDRPDSSDWYAIHRPSGENIGIVPLAGVLRKTEGLPGFQPDFSSPSNGRIMMSCEFCCVTSENARYFPLG